MIKTRPASCRGFTPSMTATLIALIITAKLNDAMMTVCAMV
ncbi:MAG: hypothetical protein ACKVRO_01445 [Micropepsaceae bacterium]